MSGSTPPLLSQPRVEEGADDPKLGFARTIDRSFVHRESLAEVFVTDTQPLGADAHAAAAQLPRSHAYFGDHLLQPRLYDPVLLLEACRQMGLAIAHTHYGVPFDHKFVLTTLSVDITHPDRLRVGASPCPLTALCSIGNKKVRDGRVRGYDARFRLFVSGAEVGTASVGLRFKDADGYHALRMGNRNGRPFGTTDTVAFPLVGEVPAPYLVGRSSADNVVLAGLTGEGDGVGASLRVLPHHPSLFDHPQDHLPGMVLVEAARQAALNSVLEGWGMSPAKAFPFRMEAEFVRFGELEPRTDIRTGVRSAEGGDDDVYYTQGGTVEYRSRSERSAAEPVLVDVDVRQQEETIARVVVGTLHLPELVAAHRGHGRWGRGTA